MLSFFKRNAVNISLGFLISGALVRVVLFFRGHSLFLDEANLARNYDEKSFLQLFGHLDYGQYAPPFFSVIEKIFLTIFGNVEFALWILPLLTGLGTLYLFYRLCKHFISREHIIYPIALISLSAIFLKYSVIAKQYSSDAFTTLLLIVLAVETNPNKFSFSKGFIWGILGAVAIWFSMTSVFVLAGVGLYLFVTQISSRSWKVMIYTFIASLFWLTSFSVYYLLLLKEQASSPYLQHYHAADFFIFPPTTWEELQQTHQVIIKIFTTVLGPTVLGLGWGIICFVLGLRKLFKENAGKAILISTPVFLCLTASAMHLYSLQARLTLFFIPLVILLTGIGVEFIFSINKNVWMKRILIVILIITVFNGIAFRYFYEPLEMEEIKQALDYMNDHKKEEELLFIHHGAVPAFIFYTEKYKHKDRYQFTNYVHGYYPAKWDTLRKMAETQPTIWVLLTNITPEEKQESLNQIHSMGKEEMNFETYGASCYLFQINQDTD